MPPTTPPTTPAEPLSPIDACLRLARANAELRRRLDAHLAGWFGLSLNDFTNPADAGRRPRSAPAPHRPGRAAGPHRLGRDPPPRPPRAGRAGAAPRQPRRRPGGAHLAHPRRGGEGPRRPRRPHARPPRTCWSSASAQRRSPRWGRCWDAWSPHPCTPAWRPGRPDLLLVALDGVLGSHLGVVGSMPARSPRPPLAEQVPALVERHLRSRTRSAVDRIAAATAARSRPVLLGDELGDPPQDVVVHGPILARHAPPSHHLSVQGARIEAIAPQLLEGRQVGADLGRAHLGGHG